MRSRIRAIASLQANAATTLQYMQLRTSKHYLFY